MKMTPFMLWHERHGAKLIEFHDWLMSVHYSGIVEEYWAVRKQCGLFDICHMGVFAVQGIDAEFFLQKALTNDLRNISPGSCLYSLLCNSAGGIIDDIIVYKHSHTVFTLVVNAANANNDFLHLTALQESYRVTLENLSSRSVLLSLQGPASRQILDSLTEKKVLELTYFSFKEMTIGNLPVFISRTGYTGELGYEIFYYPEQTDNQETQVLWETLIAQGATPCGLGARDILRLEMKYPLHGNDIDLSTNPLEAGLGWVVKFSKEDFLGKQRLLEIKQEGLQRKLVGIAMKGRQIPRHGYMLWNIRGEKIGEVTSGTFSPSLQQGIALGYVLIEESSIGNKIEIDIRGQRYPAEIVKTPFVPSHVRD